MSRAERLGETFTKADSLTDIAVGVRSLMEDILSDFRETNELIDQSIQSLMGSGAQACTNNT